MARSKKANIANQGPTIEDVSSLGAIINRELKQSLTYDQSQLATKRATAQEYVRGIMPDLPGRPNGSQQTSRDISDVMSWMLPGIMRTLTASDQMVRYSAVKNDDPAWQDQASAFANWSFFRDNDGYRNLYDATYDSLLMGNGVPYCYYEDEVTKDQTLKGQTLEDIADLMTGVDRDDEDYQDKQVDRATVEDLVNGNGPVRILSYMPDGKKTVEDENGNSTEQPTYTLKIRKVLRKGKICHSTGKTENLLINAAATTLEDARFVAYLHDDYTRSDLVEMGFDKALVDSLAPGPNFARNQVELARRYELTTNWQSPIRSGDRIDTYECYIKADADGDGIAELLQVWYAGTIGAGVVLSWDYWEDDLPFTDIPCYPIPHRWDAESVADRTVDIQRVNTVLTRGLLDQTYWNNAPQRVAVEGSILNPDAMVNPRFGSTLWAKKGTDPRAAVANLEIPYNGDKIIAGLQYMQEMITRRTGVSRTTMALDPEALQNQTATASQNLRDAGASQVELVARNMAELGWSKYFAKFLRLAVKHKIIARIPNPDKNATDQEFIFVDAGKWPDDMAVSINTGLGTGSRDRDMSMLNVMLGTQISMAQQLAQTGVPTLRAKALEFLPKIIQTAELQAEAAGIKDPSSHYIAITDQDVQQAMQEVRQMSQQGNPDTQLAQLKIQGEQQQQQSDIQIATVRGQAEIAAANANLQIKQLEVQQAQRDAVYKDQIAGLELQLQAAKADADNNTKLKSQALNNLTQIIVAGLNNKAALDTVQVEGWLEAVIGIQQHEQNKEMAQLNASLAPAPKPANGAAN